MSTVISKNLQIGADTTATNNFTIYQPATPNGTLLIGNGNTGITSSLVTLTSAGNVGVGITPRAKLDVNGGIILANSQNLSWGGVYGAGIPLIAGSSTVGLDFYANGSTGGLQMRLDSSGNLGLGVTPSAWDTTTTSRAIQFGRSGSLFYSTLNAQSVFGNNYYQTGATSFTYLGNGYAQRYAQSDFSGAHIWYTAASGTAGNAITFTQAMTLDASGNLLVGTTSATIGGSAGIRSLPAGDGANLPIFAVSTTGSTSATAPLQIYAVGTGYRFYVSANGQISATITTISAISDARFKENVRDLDAGLTEVMALKPRLYDWKEGKGADIKNARGFIAQEFEQVFPDLIDEWKDPAPEGEEPYKSVRQDLIPVLVKAIQEQQALILTLQADVAALKAAA